MLDIRPFAWDDERLVAILNRGSAIDDEVMGRTMEIISSVRKGGDAALFDYTRRFDKAEITADTLEASEKEFEEACKNVSESFLTSISLARVNIRKFHDYQRRSGYVHDDGDGVRLSKRVIPLSRVGVYCPGGSAPLFSSLMMNVIPAQIAGVGDIFVATPPRPDGSIDPHLLATARLLGISRVFKMGGAQAVAAFAYGTQSVPKVDKITGPGNAYVATAKRLVFGTVGVDSVAGPSEIVVIADHTASARYVAADLLSQVEHGSGYEAGVVFTDDRNFAAAVRIEVDRMLDRLERADAIRRALSRFGAVFLCRDLLQAVDAANAIAPEHLEIMAQDSQVLLSEVENAGAVFLGPWSTEPVGDYFAGTNHVLPTGGAARFSSSLSVYDFIKDMSVIEYSAKRLIHTGRHIIDMAMTEGMTAHANAVRVRMEDLERG